MNAAKIRLIQHHINIAFKLQSRLDSNKAMDAYTKAHIEYDLIDSIEYAVDIVENYSAPEYPNLFLYNS